MAEITPLVPTKVRVAHEAVVRTMAKDVVKAEALLAGMKHVLAIREKELLDLKGPCSNKDCRLHYAHSGPCDCRVGRRKLGPEGTA